ncbi:MAG: transcription antitermination factor NusB [Alphaproteobacteria bacterium]
MSDVEAASVEKNKGSRSASRLAAVQALYQVASTEITAAQVVTEFRVWRLGKEQDGDEYRPADSAFFEDVVSGTAERMEQIDAAIEAAVQGRSLARVERLVLAILRAGTYELVARPDVPTPVVINEYLDIANAFFSASEPAFVNGVLDRIARSARPGAG